MKINGVTPNKVINLYNVSKKEAPAGTKKAGSDVIQISSLGKSLSNMSIENNFEVSEKKIEEIREKLSQGTYKPDARLVAQKMMDILRGSDV